MTCKKCGSDVVTIQSINTMELVKKKHNIWYWLLFGWVIDLILWVFLTVPRLLIALFLPKKQRLKNKTKTMAVCQNCGYSWQIGGEK